MLLEIDAGNSRLKWRLSEKQRGAWKQRAQGVVASAYIGETLDHLLAQLAPLDIRNISRVLVSSVRGDEFDQALAALVEKHHAVKAKFAVAQSKKNGVKNGYDEPRKLGVDRWLAVLAAHNDTRRACCVLDCGTTITLDIVSAEGHHLGGYIVPGLRLMRESLANRSSALQIAEVESFLEPGRDTGAAISNGVLNMALGFVNFMHRKADTLLHEHAKLKKDSAPKKAARWYITGGDAELLASYLEWKYRIVPDLVLDGLRLSLLR